MYISRIIDRINYIARNSSKFKIGKTGQKLRERLEGHKHFTHIAKIISLKRKAEIEALEEIMIEIFKDHYPNCRNRKAGSAGGIKKSNKYILYVTYSLKRK
jgi:hypothetical protein